jgi:cysteine sulfinate desulfinase/cysteine desulfurase-like protein
LGRACELAKERKISSNFSVSDLLWKTIKIELKKDAKTKFRLNSTAPVRSRFTLNFSVAGMNGPTMVSELGNDNVYGIKICFSAGSACHSRGCPTPSKVLAAMGLESEFSTSGVRVSINHKLSEEEIKEPGKVVATHCSL